MDLFFSREVSEKERDQGSKTVTRKEKRVRILELELAGSFED